MRQAGWRAEKEVYNKLVAFISSAPQSGGTNGRATFLNRNGKYKQCIVPDLITYPANGGASFLYELKTLALSTTGYQTKITRAMERNKRAAVRTRAKTIHKEYVNKARNMDRTFNGTAADVQGPVEIELNRLSPEGVTPLVVGCFGEINADLQEIIKNCCHDIAMKVWRKGGYLSCQVAASQIYQSKIRRIGYLALKSSSQLIIGRLDFVGDNVYEVYQRQVNRNRLKFNLHYKRRVMEQNRINSLKLGPRRYYSNFIKSSW